MKVDSCAVIQPTKKCHACMFVCENVAGLQVFSEARGIGSPGAEVSEIMGGLTKVLGTKLSSSEREEQSITLTTETSLSSQNAVLKQRSYILLYPCQPPVKVPKFLVSRFLQLGFSLLILFPLSGLEQFY